MQLINQVIADGETKVFPFDWSFFVTEDIRVYVDNEMVGNWVVSDDRTSIIMSTAPVSGSLVEVIRYTTAKNLADFFGGSILVSSSIDVGYQQMVHVVEETKEFLDGAIIWSPALDAYNGRQHVISDAGMALYSDDAVTLRYLSAAVAGYNYDPLDAQAILDAIASITAIIAVLDYNAAAIAAARASLQVKIDALRALLAQLLLLSLDPEPHGADLIAAIDAELGQTVWRDLSPDLGVVTYDADGTWETPEGFTFEHVLVECWGGGAAGAAFDKTAAILSTGSGGAPSMPGGGGGGYTRRFMEVAALAASVPVTVGAGGTPGITPGDGGSSSFGSYVTAPGGKAPTSRAAGGDGGAPFHAPPRGIGGSIVENHVFDQPGTIAFSGAVHGGGGGAGYASSPDANNAPASIMNGAAAVAGGGGGGGGATSLVRIQAPVTLLPVSWYYNTPTNSYGIMPISELYVSRRNNGYPHYVVLDEYYWKKIGGTTRVYLRTFVDVTNFVVQRTSSLTVSNSLLAQPTKWQYVGFNTPGGVKTFVFIDISSTGLVGVEGRAYPGYPSGIGQTTSGGTVGSGYLPAGVGGESMRGGAGGNGGQIGQAGRAGSVPGGGGGGAGIAQAAWNTSTTQMLGGPGGHGRVRLSFF